MDSSLDTQVRLLLESKRGEWKAIALSAGVSYSWLSKFACGRIDNPGYATLKRVQALLAPRPRRARSKAVETN